MGPFLLLIIHVFFDVCHKNTFRVKHNENSAEDRRGKGEWGIKKKIEEEMSNLSQSTSIRLQGQKFHFM